MTEFFGKAPPIPTGHSAFDQQFDVYARDKGLVESLLSPGFLDDLLAIDTLPRFGTPTAAFHDGRFLLTLPTSRELFEPGYLNRSVLDAEGDLLALLEDIRIAHRIIDILHGQRPSASA